MLARRFQLAPTNPVIKEVNEPGAGRGYAASSNLTLGRIIVCSESRTWGLRVRSDGFRSCFKNPVRSQHSAPPLIRKEHPEPCLHVAWEPEALKATSAFHTWRVQYAVGWAEAAPQGAATGSGIPEQPSEQS